MEFPTKATKNMPCHLLCSVCVYMCVCVYVYILKLEKVPSASRERLASTGVAVDKDSPLMTADCGEEAGRLLRPADQLCPCTTATKVPMATSRINNRPIPDDCRSSSVQIMTGYVQQC